MFDYSPVIICYNEIISGMVDFFFVITVRWVTVSQLLSTRLMCGCVCLKFFTVDTVNGAVEREQVREIEIKEEGEPIGVFFWYWYFFP